MAGFEVTGPVVLLGTLTGLTYGLLAVGLVLVYRSNRVINFAHGEIGAVGAAVLGLAVVQWGIPYWVAFPVAIAVSGGIGATAEVVVIRRLRRAPHVMSIIATLGLAMFLLLFAFAINAQVGVGRLFPQPAGFPSFEVGALHVTPAYLAMLVLGPLLVLVLVLFLRNTRTGIAMRGAADNPESARLVGIFAMRMSTLSWAIAGGLSAFTAVLVLPTRGFLTAESLGPGLLLRALVPAVIARMHSLPVALGAGVVVGIVEHQLLWNLPGGTVEATLFVVVLGVLLVQRRRLGRAEERGSWAAVQPWLPLHEALREVWIIRNLGKVIAVIAFLVALGLAAVMTHAAATILTILIAFSVVGLSIGIVTGSAGQLSLGQFAIAGIGATASVQVVIGTGNFVLGFAAAALAAAGVSLLVGLPALRIRGLMLAVTTLSFALATQFWILSRGWLLGEGLDPGRPVIAGISLDTGRSYYIFALGVLALCLWFAHNVWRSGFGRRLRAVRDNEENARAFAISAVTVKLQAFAVAGLLAGIGGALFGHTLSRLSATAFPVGASINVVAMAVLGGLGILVGPILGAFYVVGIPEFLPLDNAGLAAQALGWLILILYFPGGIAQVVGPLRDRSIIWLARRAGVEEAEDPAFLTRSADERTFSDVRFVQEPAPEAAESASVLEAVDLARSFGGVRAVDGVSLEVRAGETVGVIGPNGAGKTTLFEIIGGFTRSDEGVVRFRGQDISAVSAERRARLGLIRSFQDAFLFPTLTVLETVQIAAERRLPSRLAPALLGLDRREGRREQRARDIVHLMGLDGFRHKQIRELSTGTRRITELACMIALEPELLLLDEPSSGVAQRESEALGELLERVRAHLGMTMLVIEHNMPLIASLADRIVAMESGKKIAEGSPTEVQRDPKVVASYLGGEAVG